MKVVSSVTLCNHFGKDSCALISKRRERLSSILGMRNHLGIKACHSQGKIVVLSDELALGTIFSIYKNETLKFVSRFVDIVSCI